MYFLILILSFCDELDLGFQCFCILELQNQSYDEFYGALDLAVAALFLNRSGFAVFGPRLSARAVGVCACVCV
jgi:hypothetical protein